MYLLAASPLLLSHCTWSMLSATYKVKDKVKVKVKVEVERYLHSVQVHARRADGDCGEGELRDRAHLVGKDKR